MNTLECSQRLTFNNLQVLIGYQLHKSNPQEGATMPAATATFQAKGNHLSVAMDFKTALDEDMRNKGVNERLLGQHLQVTQQSINKWRQRGFPPLYRVKQLIEYFGPNSNIAKLDFGRMVQDTPRVRIVAPANVPGRETLSDLRPRVFASMSDRMEYQKEQEARLRELLPPSLQGNCEGAMLVGNAKLRFDYLSERLVAELVVHAQNTPVSLASPSRKLLDLVAARTANPNLRPVLAIISEEPDTTRILPPSRMEVAKALGVDVIHFRSADELAMALVRAEGLDDGDDFELEEIDE